MLLLVRFKDEIIFYRLELWWRFMCRRIAGMGRGFVTLRCTRVSDRVGSSGHRIMNLPVCRITGQKFKLGSVTA